ncbi:MAG TPA: AMP-binding protein [Parvibaculum sp.]
MNRELWKFFGDAPGTLAMVLRGDKILSKRDICAEALRIRARCSEASEPVFLYCEDAGNFLAGLIGALGGGCDVLLPGHAAPAYLREIGAVGTRLLTDVRGLDADAVIIGAEVLAPGAISEPIYPDDKARIGFFTSGSTGEPKPYVKNLAQLFSEIEVHLKLWGLPKGPVIGTVSHQHIYGLLFRVFWPLMAGKPVVAERQEMWESVAHLMSAGGIVISSPAHLSRIPDNFSLPHRPDFIFSSGGPLSLDASRDAFGKLGRYPVEVLGSTETGGVAWRTQEQPASLWTPLPGVEIKPNEDGVLAIRSPFADMHDFVTMGDQAKLASDGRFSLHARIDRVVKIEGKRVSLPRVEETLRELADINDASVIDLPDRGGALGAVAVLAPGGEAMLKEIGRFRYSRYLRKALSERLEPMERPRLWRFLTHIPENAQGKRTAAELRALFAQERPEMPTVIRREIGETEAHFDLELNSDLCWFDGHFPGQPILPGVAQLHIASSFAEEAWGVIATGSEMSRVKFRRVMQPGDLVTLMLIRNGANDRLDFRYLEGGEVMASGAIKGVEP